MTGAMPDTLGYRGWIDRWPSRERWRRTAQWLIVFLAVSIPVSTSATSIFAGLAMVACLAAVPPAQFRLLFRHPVVLASFGLPLLTLVGVLWTSAPLGELAEAFEKYGRLVLIGLLMAVLIDRRAIERVLIASAIVMVAILVLSYASVLWPSGPWQWMAQPGIPLKSYSIQSMGFVLVAFALGHIGIDRWIAGDRRIALVLLALAAAFIVNVIFVASSRTTWIGLVPILMLFFVQRIGLRGALIGLVLAAVCAPAIWFSSPYVRERVSIAVGEVEIFRSSENVSQQYATRTSVGTRLVLWEYGLEFVSNAPVIGHGTGMIGPLYSQEASDDDGPVATTDDPHSQLFGVAIPYGTLGLAALAALWITLALAFRGRGLFMWLGQAFLIQHVVSSLFFSSIWIFDRGWMFIVFSAVFTAASLLGEPEEAAARARGA